MNDIKAWMDAVKDIRPLLKSGDEWKALTDGTRRDYEQKFAVLGSRLPAQYAQCKKSYYTARAAYLHCQTRAIRKGLNELDRWAKAQGGTEALKRRSGDYLGCVRALGLDKLIGDYKAVSTAGAFVGSSHGVKQPSHAKRMVGKLPNAWKTKLLGGIPKESKYKAHVAAMALCGCRPSEFEDGVLVSKVDEDTYEFTITGKKTGTRTKNGKTFTTGQTQRTVTITRTGTLDKHGYASPEFIVLEKALKGKTYAELTAKATAIRDVVIHASEKAFPKLQNKPTAYSFRHAFASELKAANGSDSEVTAAALGHASTKTQGCYGYKVSGGGGFACKATATDRIRTPHLGRVAGLAKAKAKKMTVAVKVNSEYSIEAAFDRVVANINSPSVAVKRKIEPQKPAPSFAKSPRMRF